MDAIFPVKGKSALLSIAWGKLYFSGQPQNNPDAVANVSIKSNVRHTLIVEVRNASLTAVLDGKRIKTIDPKVSLYLCNPHWRMPDQETVGVSAWESGVVYHRIAIRNVTGTGRAKEPDPDLARITTAEHWNDAVDLLAVADPKKNTVAGKWALENGKLVAGQAQYGRMELGYEPPEEYDFRVDFHRIDGKRDIVQINSVNSRQFSWKFSADDYCAIDTIEGKIHGNSPASLITPEFGRDTNTHTSVVCIRKDGIRAFVDGKLIAKWKTDFSDMGIDIWKLKHAKVLGVGVHDSNVVYEKIL